MGHTNFTSKRELLQLAGFFVYVLFIPHQQLTQSSTGPSIQKDEKELMARTVGAEEGAVVLAFMYTLVCTCLFLKM